MKRKSEFVLGEIKVARALSLRRITAVLHITTEAPAKMELARSSERKNQSLKQHLLEKMKTWINGLLEG